MSDSNVIIQSSDVSAELAALHPQSLAFEVDVEKYLAFTRGFDLSDEQQVQLIHAMWQIMKAFVDIGFEIHPAQQALANRGFDDSACGEFGKRSKESPLALTTMLKSLIDNTDDLDRQFNRCAAPIEA